MAAPPSRLPPFARSTWRIFELSLGQTLWSRRSVFLALLVVGPVLLATVVRLLAAMAPSTASFRINGAVVSGSSMFGLMIWVLYLRFIVPVLGVFYGTSLVADEIEDKTITYLFTRPIRRSAVVAGKYLAYLACTVLLILPSVVLVYLLITPLGGGNIGQTFPALLKDLGMLALGLVAYGALFSLVGARLKRPLVSGLIFVLGWEPAILVFPGYLKRATVAYYLQALVPHAMPEDSNLALLFSFVRDVPAASLSLATLLGMAAVCLWLAGRAIERREYVLEQ
jgi:ABC-2 type transport system permease protein